MAIASSPGMGPGAAGWLCLRIAGGTAALPWLSSPLLVAVRAVVGCRRKKRVQSLYRTVNPRTWLVGALRTLCALWSLLPVAVERNASYALHVSAKSRASRAGIISKAVYRAEAV